MERKISASLTSRLAKFKELCAKIASQSATSSKSIYISPCNGELGHLRLWAANIGAHRKGQSSLDLRMRDASHIREQIIALFEDPKNKLLKTEQVLSEIGEPWEDSTDGDSSDNDDP